MAQRAGVTFELERLDLRGGELVVSGHWSGVRGLRFVRPTLVADNRRILATLEHKPWAPSLDRPWTAAFPWKGDTVDVDGLTLAVAPQVTVPLGEALVADPEPPPPTKAKTKRARAAKAARPGRRTKGAGPAQPPEAEPEPKAAEPGRRRKAAGPVQPAGATEPEPAPDEASEPEPEPARAEPSPTEPIAAEPSPAEPAEPEPAPAAPEQGAAGPSAVAALEAELDAVVHERDALRRRLDDAVERERRASDRAAVALDELARAREAAERDRGRALAQVAEAVEAREAAVRTRARMQAAHDEALRAREAVEAALAAAHAQRDEANAQRDEVLLAYRGLQRHMRTERAQEDRARGGEQEPGERAEERGEDAPDEPIGVRTMPAARTVMAELQRPPPARKLPFSQFDLWVIRVLGTVAAGCFILLLVSILRVFL